MPFALILQTLAVCNKHILSFTVTSTAIQWQVPVNEECSGTQSSGWTMYMCFTIWRDHIWVGTNRGTVTVVNSQNGECVKHISFPGEGKRQVEIRHLALSNEDEVRPAVYAYVLKFTTRLNPRALGNS